MFTERGQRTARRVGLALGAALLVASCHDGAWHPTFVVGDSTAALVEVVTGEGSTTSGCGFTEHANCMIQYDGSGATGPIVAFVSLWDRDAPDVQGYVDAHAALSEHGPVVWVEVPPVFGNPESPWNPKLAALNVAVAGALGCELVPHSHRDGQTYDGIHYTLAGAQWVSTLVSGLTEDDACPPIATTATTTLP